MSKTPYEAFDKFRSSLQKAVSCVNREAHVWAFIGTDGYSPGQNHALVPNLGDPVRLRGDIELSFLSRTWYRVVRVEGGQDLWGVMVVAYSHRLETADEKEVIAFHWHPGKGSGVVHPHMHLGAGVGADLGLLDKTHIPTGEIRVEDLLSFAVQELGAEPQREDWSEILYRIEPKPKCRT